MIAHSRHYKFLDPPLLRNANIGFHSFEIRLDKKYYSMNNRPGMSLFEKYRSNAHVP